MFPGPSENTCTIGRLGRTEKRKQEGLTACVISAACVIHGEKKHRNLEAFTLPVVMGAIHPAILGRFSIAKWRSPMKISNEERAKYRIDDERYAPSLDRVKIA